ncbi:hypothetical protein EVAR_16649_1 [Eumeta japonica]|uniref:Uncharacterized protein n=1 Tax=Eumeta variegata TaxID=151549 RepID=A0A4C1V1C7_EUMVA|nr:hypothetical protein EVAR_16649_1 [Eumeta japonica]
MITATRGRSQLGKNHQCIAGLLYRNRMPVGGGKGQKMGGGVTEEGPGRPPELLLTGQNTTAEGTLHTTLKLTAGDKGLTTP